MPKKLIEIASEIVQTQVSRFPWDENEGAQEEIWLGDAGSLGRKVIDKSQKQNCQKKGTARKAAEVY
jgi:hypothetical protein